MEFNTAFGYIAAIAISLLQHSSLALSESELHELNYEGFNLIVDCKLKGAIRFEYLISKDTGTFPRKNTFTFDNSFLRECQQDSVNTYKSNPSKYDRGHLVPANHLDHSKLAIAQSNFITNILPQARNMNRGAWLQTEEIIECYRERETLRVIGGVIWGYNPHDDYFLESHGVKTPDYFWKVVVGKEDAIAWIIPNNHAAKRKELDSYLVSILEIERLTQQKIDNISDLLRNKKHHQSWPKLSGCDLS